MTRLYFSLERAVLFLHNGLAATLQGTALGLIDDPDLEALTVDRYHRTALSTSSYAKPHHLDGGLFLWEREAISRYFPAGGRILVAAAGAGREIIALNKAGYRADGFDCCRPLVDAGRKALAERGIPSRLEYAPPSDVPRFGEAFDGAVIGFSGYMYVPGRDRRVSFLRNLLAYLPEGAPLMVSFEEGAAGKRRTWTAGIGRSVRKLRGRRPIEEGDCLKDGFQHHFLPHQIESEFAEAGLDMVLYSGGTCYGHAVGLKRQRNRI